ncbi:DsbE family thiol:disulfide interchange protein [Altererythrobacter sp. FM1]|uniref:DsbE family thiol:disulfide interchange protein n=1 Tax=Tsuneonella flava TaxID=2055955 RepID=UPI000C80189A|nr:DsbE family thiol:disulfide interchange protein [Tsuneonella flava]ROT94807.1 DsbE family thiol:disulfide interchange protein [Altererythrobacter sp. FM1]
MKHWRYFLPLAVFVAFVGVAAWQLTRPRDDFVHSAMIGKEVPSFDLPTAVGDRPALSTANLKDGKPKLLNIWASWCIPCAAEAPQLARLQEAGATIVGVAIRDRPEDVAAFLDRYGNPYARIGRDDLSKVQLSIGSSGVPETFVVDGNGVIRYQHIGDVRPEDVQLLLSKLEEAKR